jgi:cell wall-associated NlpC family hydrolase
VAQARTARFRRALIVSTVLAAATVATPLAAGAMPSLDPPSSAAAAGSATVSASPSAPTTTAAPATSGDVMAQLAELATANEKLTEQFNSAQTALAAAQHRVAGAKNTAAIAAKKLAVTRRALGALLAQQYMSPSFSHTAALFNSDSGQGYLDQLQSLQQVTDHQASIAHAAQADASTAAGAEATEQAALDAAAAQKRAVIAQRVALQTKVSRYQSQLATLTANERTTFLGSSNATPLQISSALANYTIGASPADVVAIKAALAELGKPYIWAAGGPSAFDCSGLTMWAWAKAGVSMPHLAASQQNLGTRVDRSALRPGDLVFFGSPAYHVAMYLGSGMIVQAPNSGDVVKISPLASMSDYSSAARIG